MMDYPYGKFGDCSFSRFGSIVRTHTHTHTHTHTCTHGHADADKRFTPATVVGVSNKCNNNNNNNNEHRSMNRHILDGSSLNMIGN